METAIVGFVVGAAIGAAVAALLVREAGRRRRAGVVARSAEQKEAAKREAAAAVREAEVSARERVARARLDAERETEALREDLTSRDRALTRRETAIEGLAHGLDQREAEIEQRRQALRERETGLGNLQDQLFRSRQDEVAKLEEMAQTTVAQIVRDLADDRVAKAQHDAEGRLRQLDDAGLAERTARRVLATATERRDAGVGTGKVSAAIALTSDASARLTAADGRLLKALTEATGIGLVLSEKGDAIHLEGNDPLKREVARRAVEDVTSGPDRGTGRIPKLVRDLAAGLDNEIRELGERAFRELRQRPARRELVSLVGRLNWRYSYGQNQWRHAVESAHLAGLIAAEIGLDERKARRAALLHDVGKALTHELDGGHALIGAEYVRKYGEPSDIASAIASHHGDQPIDTLLGHLVAAADTLSGGRPGARRESSDIYFKRIEDLETIAGSFHGVESAYAIQAGREVRLFVAAERVSDATAAEIARSVAGKIEEALVYPGQIKVVVIRQHRAVAYAN